MTKEYNYAVVIGRFQPFHNVHKQMVEKAFEIADQVVVVVGSSYVAPNIKNPFSISERAVMIGECFPGVVEGKTTEYFKRLKIAPVRDYYYDDQTWAANVKSVVGAKHGDSVALIGHYKDTSSYYLKMLDWTFIPFNSNSSLDSTQIRDLLFDVHKWSDWEGKAKLDLKFVMEQEKLLGERVPEPVLHSLKEFMTTNAYANLIDEYKQVKLYKHQWRNVPFPPLFVTTDAVVTCAGHVLVVKRKHHPGKGLYALPGGFIKPSESLQDGMIRELLEETRIRMSKEALLSRIKHSKVFDFPNRSLRGRTITHAYLIDLPNHDLPEVEGGDDAAEAKWIPVMDVLPKEDQFYEDHAQIINYFNTVGGMG